MLGQFVEGPAISSPSHSFEPDSDPVDAISESHPLRDFEALFRDHSRALDRFLVGILKDGALAADAMQSTFSKLVEKGGAVQPGALKSWLFRVAYNEAMLIRRKSSALQRKIENSAWAITARHQEQQTDGLAEAMRSESIELVRLALEKLPVEQRTVVQMRIYDELKFKDISQRTGKPLGTVLSRMQLALKKLRTILPNEMILER